MYKHKPSDEEKRTEEYQELEKRKEEILEQEIQAFAELLLDIWEWRQQEKQKKISESGSSPTGV